MAAIRFFKMLIMMHCIFIRGSLKSTFSFKALFWEGGRDGSQKEYSVLTNVDDHLTNQTSMTMLYSSQAKVQWTPEHADKTAIERRPFSMVEERRLRRGVHQFGYNWKAIHGAFRFAKGRTAIELRNRWRGMHRPR